MPTVLHVGCGGEPLPEWLEGLDEVRLDISPDHSPDVLASMTHMGDIGPFDRLLCSHALEHLNPREAETALGEFYRVLKPGGVAFVIVPDLEDVRPTLEVVYLSPSGPITGRDMYYGHADMVSDMPHMTHRTGFVSETLAQAMGGAGFKVETKRLGFHNLLGVGVKP